MPLAVRTYTESDLFALTSIWNAVVEAGNAFPQTEPLTPREAERFFAEQSRTAVAVTEQGLRGLYILHPNNVGRCGHIANASYAVHPASRGEGIGEALVRDSLHAAKALGFRIMQFNAVVAANVTALRLYERLGFVRLGEIPGGFRMPDGTYETIIPMICPLD